ncbi:MAG: metallophosphoesterase [Armatimonadota bacterium]|nr:metallophosphoesterase [bacterium]
MEQFVVSRVIAIIIIMGLLWIVAYENLRILCLAILRRKMSLSTKILWPSLAALVVICALDSVYIEPNWVQVTHHTIQTYKLPAGSRVRVVQLSDLHVMDHGARETRVLRLTQKQQPDIIVLTGDYLNARTPAARVVLLGLIRNLTRIAPVYAVGGNWEDYPDMEELVRVGAHYQMGWTEVTVKGNKFALGGQWWGTTSVVPYPPDYKPLFKVLLCHTPWSFSDAQRKGIDLMLVGHTHGGQVRLPIFGTLMPIRSLIDEYQAGFYKKGHSLLYVSRGIGTESIAPVRFWCRPEVAVFDIMGKEN